MDHHHYIYFKENRLCRLDILGRKLFISEYRHRELFFIKLYLSNVLRRNDFDSVAVFVDDHIEYPLHGADIIMLVKKGFPYRLVSPPTGSNEFLMCY